MKILYLMTEPFGYGGVQSDILALSEDLTARNHEVFVATTEGELLEELKSKGAIFCPIDFNISGFGGMLAAAKALNALVEQHGIDLVAPQSVRSSLVTLLALKIMHRGARPPIVTTIHNIHNPVHFRYAGWLLRACADYVIFESHYERDRLLKSGLPADRSGVVHSGIDVVKYAPREPSQRILEEFSLDKTQHKTMAIVARLSEEKGHNYLLEAFAKRVEVDSNLRLLIVGDGPLRAEVEAKIDELQLHDTVTMTGARRDVDEILSVIDAFVLSSTRESFPLAAREAMAAGRAVVAPRIGGCPEVVDHEVNGYLFESRNADDLAQCIGKLTEGDTAERFGQAAREKVVTQFSRKAWVEGDEEIYLQALSGSLDERHRSAV
ncbi:MAG: glycosyltransferase family 4 protein [Granulosicoccaceae bacterium]